MGVEECAAARRGRGCRRSVSPVSGAALFVLDGWLRAVPAGVVGELYVAGARGGGGVLASGGVDRVAVCGVSVRGVGAPGHGCIAPGIWCGGAPMGSCAYVGRADEQVKIRGYRIELGEIEAALAAHPRVAQAVVTARRTDPGPVEGVSDKQLVGYVVLDQGDAAGPGAGARGAAR